jgi:hypothetical protein
MTTNRDRPIPVEPAVVDAWRRVKDAAALGLLLPLFAHAANNRLTVILAGLDLLAQVDLADADLSETLRLARDAGAGLVADLATLQATSRTRTPQPTSVNIREAVSAAIRLVDLAAARPLAVDVEVAPDLRVSLSPGALEFAISELLWLAAQRGATSVTLRASRVEPPKEHRASGAQRHRSRIRMEMRLEGVAPAASWLRGMAQAGQVIERLEDPDNLEYAAVEAFALSVRGTLFTRAEGSSTVFELDIPDA